MEKRKVLKFDGDKLYLNVYQYQDNGRIAILLDTTDGECYGDITINLPGVYIERKSIVFIDALTTISGLEKKLQDKGIITEILGKQPYNMETYTKASIDIEKLKEYDSEGVKKFLGGKN